MANNINIGDTYGFWEILEFKNSQYLECICTGCNSTHRTIRKWTLLRGESKSCGCQIETLMKETNQKKYGVDFVQQNSQIKQKSVETLEKKYGVDNAMKVAEFQKKSRMTKLVKTAKAKGGMIFGVDTYKKL